MTNDEMRALVDEIRSANKAYKCVPNYMGDAAADALETLLARQAEVLAVLEPDTPYMDEQQAVRFDLSEIIRAILYPQPAALAKEKTNG